MTSQSMSRKRPAPGSSNIQYQQQMPQHQQNFDPASTSNLSDDQFLQWGQSAQPQPYADLPAYSVPQNGASTQLTRRPVNAIAARPIQPSQTHQWVDPARDNSPVDGAWSDDIQVLEAKAQVAKREAQTKRKQIPPFVQKLNSFLEDGRNTELIRWSDEGNSFIVLDEDEFAKTLIPELFKHNNYASFVRQLNMYGFHKKVGLSDNSMRASERKNKSPSEYANPYFRRGHPDLLWLIQKPKTTTTTGKPKGKPKQEDAEDDDDFGEESNAITDGRFKPKPQLALEQAGESTLSVEQFQGIQRELAAIRHQQMQISRMMTALRREHEQLYGQAASFQDQHTRHENSINAILTFLATVYNRSLQGHEGMSNMFTGAIPHDTSTANVVDVGDYSFEGLANDNTLGKSFKKPQLLLTDGQAGNSAADTPYPQRPGRQSPVSLRNSRTPQPAHIEELYDNNTSSPSARSARDDFLAVIRDTNSRTSQSNSPAPDFSNVLNSLEHSGGNTPLNAAQRADMLRLINNSARQTGDNALVNTTPPSGPTHYDRKLASARADLDSLARLQAEQNKSVQNLTNLLQPLSPTGSIPGIGDGQSLPPPPLDIDDFLNHNEYFADFPSDGLGNYEFNNNPQGVTELDFDYDNHDDDELFKGVSAGVQNGDDAQYKQHGSENGDVGGRIQSIASSEATTPNTHNDTDAVSPMNSKGKGRKLSVVSELEGQNSPMKKKRKS